MIIEFVPKDKIDSKRKSLECLLKCLEMLTLSKLSELELDYYQTEKPGLILEKAQALSLKLIGQKHLLKTPSSNLKVLDSQILGLKNSIRGIHCVAGDV